MKKKFLVIMTAVIMAFVCAVGLIACSDDSKINGTYYAYSYDGTQKMDNVILEFKDGKFTETVSYGQDETSVATGTYKVDGDKVTVEAEVMGKKMTQELTIVSDGVLKDSQGIYYCMDGKTPPTAEE